MLTKKRKEKTVVVEEHYMVELVRKIKKYYQVTNYSGNLITISLELDKKFGQQTGRLSKRKKKSLETEARTISDGESQLVQSVVRGIIGPEYKIINTGFDQKGINLQIHIYITKQCAIIY